MVIGNVDADADPELVVTLISGLRIYAFNANGDSVPNFPISVTRDGSESTAFYSPEITDLDGDGRVDIVATTMDAYVYRFSVDAPFIPGANSWPRFQRHLTRDGRP